MPEKRYSAPKTVKGAPVFASGDPLDVRGELWQTLAPEDNEDDRLWEYSLTTGRILQTRP